MDLSYLILIGITVSIDGFFAGMAYGIKKITIPYASLLTVIPIRIRYDKSIEVTSIVVFLQTIYGGSAGEVT